MLRVVTDEDARAEMRSSLDEIVLEGERRMLAAALEAEVDGYIADLADQRDAGAGGWWCATATPARTRRPPRLGDRRV